jgi:hypothetical protein
VLKVKVYPVINEVILKVHAYTISAHRSNRQVSIGTKARRKTKKEKAYRRAIKEIHPKINIKIIAW